MSEKQVIMQVIPALNQGGVERGTIEIAEALQKAGMPNIVVSSGGPMVKELEALGVEHITLPVQTKNPFKMWLNEYRLIRLIKEKNVALMHVRSRAPAWSVKWASQKTGVPYIATFHGLYGTSPAIFKKAYNRVMTQGRLVIAVSAFIKQHLIKEYGILEQHIRLIPRGADTTKFRPELVSKEQVLALAKKQNISLEKPVITLVGRLSRIKGHSVVLEAVQQMKHKAVTLLFIGGNPKGDYEEELKQKVKELPAETEIKFFKLPGDQMPVAYALSDIVVQPTLKPESFGRGIAEAQAMGKIVVASNHGGATELISNGRTGFLTAVGDVQNLAGVLDQILDMPELKRQEIEVAAMKSVQDNFSIQKMCDRTLAMYREILKNETQKNK